MKKIILFILIIMMLSSILMYNDYVNVSGENFTVTVGNTVHHNNNNGGSSGGGGSSRRSGGSSGYITNNTNQTNETIPEPVVQIPIPKPTKNNKTITQPTPKEIPEPAKPKPTTPQEIPQSIPIIAFIIFLFFILGLLIMLYYIFKPRKQEKDMMPEERQVIHPNVTKQQEITQQEIEDIMKELEEDE